MENETFETFWADVESFAEEVGVSTSYVEDEFILEGVLHKVSLTFEQPINKEQN